MYENRIDFNTVRQYGKDNVFPACRAVFLSRGDGFLDSLFQWSRTSPPAHNLLPAQI